MRPSLNSLLPYVSDRKSGALHFGVSQKTFTRWLQAENLYVPKENYGVKLNMQKARDIRRKFNDGTAIKDLAKEYQVTFSAISRVVQNISYHEVKETAKVEVIYNPR